MDFDSFGALGQHFTRLGQRVDPASAVAVEHGAQQIAASVKSKFGGYQPGWAPLKDATKAERVRKGYTPDDPLFRSGALRDAVGVKPSSDTPGGQFIGVETGDAEIGGHDAAAIMVAHEYGRPEIKLPARPVFRTVLAQDMDRHVDATVRETLAWIGE